MRGWNHLTILKAMERVPGCRFRICGFGAEDTYLQELQAMPAWERTELLGKIPHEEIPRFLADGSIGVALASYMRGNYWKTGTIGNTKIFEEMMAGLPVVCTDFTLWREFVERWHCGICVEPEDPDSIAAAIQYLLDHPAEAREMGENGRKAIEAEFNWSMEEKKLLALYKEITE